MAAAVPNLMNLCWNFLVRCCIWPLCEEQPLAFVCSWVCLKAGLRKTIKLFPPKKDCRLQITLCLRRALVVRLGTRDQSIQSALDYLFQQERGLNL